VQGESVAVGAQGSGQRRRPRRAALAEARKGNDAVKLLTALLRNHVSNRRRKTLRRAEGNEQLARERGERSAESSAELIARAEEYARV